MRQRQQAVDVGDRDSDVAAFALAGDTITLVYNALGGELTVRFILKVLVVAVLAGGTFAYFLLDMRKEEK